MVFSPWIFQTGIYISNYWQAQAGLVLTETFMYHTVILYYLYTAGEDYAVSTAVVFNVTITAGSTSSSFSVNIFNDMIQEDNETFNVIIRLLPSCLSLSLGTSSSTVTIIDNDGTSNNIYISKVVIVIIIV